MIPNKINETIVGILEDLAKQGIYDCKHNVKMIPFSKIEMIPLN